MKKAMTIVGFIASILSIIGMVFKVMHWPFAGPMLILGIGTFSLFFLPGFGYKLFCGEGKQKSKVAGVLGSIVFVFAGLTTIFKIQHWPGAGPMLILFFGTLGFILLPFLMVTKIFSANSKIEKFLNFFWYFSLSALTLGYLFKTMHWPGAGPLLLLGTLFISLGYLPIAYKLYNNDENRNKLYSRFVIIPAFLIFILLFVAGGVSKNILNSFVSIDSKINETAKAMDSKNITVFEKFKNIYSENSKLNYQKAEKVVALSDDLYLHISKLKVHLIRSCDKYPPEIPDDSLSLADANSKDNYDIPFYILIGDRDNLRKGAWSATELKAKIFVFRQDIISMYEDDMKETCDKSLSLKTDDMEYEFGQKYPWEIGYFDYFQLASVIPVLTKLQSDVRSAESMTLDYLYSRAEKEFRMNNTILSDTIPESNSTITK